MKIRSSPQTLHKTNLMDVWEFRWRRWKDPMAGTRQCGHLKTWPQELRPELCHHFPVLAWTIQEH